MINLFRWGASVLCLGAALVSFDAAGAEPARVPTEPWQEKLYNPKPSPTDLILPMPCGGSMVFVPVEVPLSGYLSDRRVVLGTTDDTIAYKEGYRTQYIGASFNNSGKQGSRLYYLAKYETTTSQYEALGDKCVKVSMKGRRPITNVSWFDALNFSRKYTEWLYEYAKDKIPSEDRMPGFLRLPTEAEWEYAARGGAVVSDTEFQADLFPMPEGTAAKYIWFEGSESSSGKVNLVGLLEPNPIGVYDILGNVGEMVLDPFRLNKSARLHGQVGGAVIKGGDFLTSKGKMRASLRFEMPYVDARTGKAATQRTVGFRLVISGPVISSPERLKKIQQEWGEQVSSVSSWGHEKTDDPLNALADLQKSLTDYASKQRLSGVLSKLQADASLRNELRDRAVWQAVRLGTFLSIKVKDDTSRLEGIKGVYDMAADALQNIRAKAKGHPDETAIVSKAKAKVGDIEKQYKRALNVRDSSLNLYSDAVMSTAIDYPENVLAPQLAALKTDWNAKSLGHLIAIADVFNKHVRVYREKKSPQSEQWLIEILGGT